MLSSSRRFSNCMLDSIRLVFLHLSPSIRHSLLFVLILDCLILSILVIGYPFSEWRQVFYVLIDGIVSSLICLVCLEVSRLTNLKFSRRLGCIAGAISIFLLSMYHTQNFGNADACFLMKGKRCSLCQTRRHLIIWLVRAVWANTFVGYLLSRPWGRSKREDDF